MCNDIIRSPAPFPPGIILRGRSRRSRPAPIDVPSIPSSVEEGWHASEYRPTVVVHDLFAIMYAEASPADYWETRRAAL